MDTQNPDLTLVTLYEIKALLEKLDGRVRKNEIDTAILVDRANRAPSLNAIVSACMAAVVGAVIKIMWR